MSKKSFLKIVLAIMLCFSISMTREHDNTIIMAAKKQPKLSQPKLIPVGTSVVQSKKKTYAKKHALTIYEKILSSAKKSKIYYTKNGKSPNKKGILYKKPIPICIKGSTKKYILKLVNTKKGYLKSKIVKREYRLLGIPPMIPFNGIECASLKKEEKSIHGTVKMMNFPQKNKLSKSIYIKFRVLRNSRTISEYTANVHDGNWVINLELPLEKGDVVTIDAYTKDCIIKLKRLGKSHDEIVGVYADSPVWKTLKTRIQ